MARPWRRSERWAARWGGLPPHVPPTEEQRARNYIGVIRGNWDLLPYDQLLQLLGWGGERLQFTLKEDDFLWVKLGRSKPECPRVHYASPTKRIRERCAWMRGVIGEDLGDALGTLSEPRFGFLNEFRGGEAGADRDISRSTHARADDEAGGRAETAAPIRLVYSYFAVYGDPLLDPGLAPYPDGLLERLALLGLNAVWLHTVLRQLAPSVAFPEFGDGRETRLANLRTLVRRATRFGIRVFLYINEPRSMPDAFFRDHADAAGASEDGNTALCTSVPGVRRFVRDGLSHVFRNVPGLGGVFAITASENLTNCWSRGSQEQCPRCRTRDPADVIAEINNDIAEGVWSADPDARVILYDWGWQDAWSERIIRQLEQAADVVQGEAETAPLEEDTRVARAAYAHIRSAANQVRFVLERDRRDGNGELRATRLRRILEEEIRLTIALYDIARRDPRIGFEPSNHYFYEPLDLVEKILDCRYLLEEWLPTDQWSVISDQ